MSWIIASQLGQSSEGAFTRSVSICARYGEWYSWWSGRYVIQKQIFKLMIIICLHELLRVWHIFCKHERLLNTKVISFIDSVWLICFPKKSKGYILIFSIRSMWPHLTWQCGCTFVSSVKPLVIRFYFFLWELLFFFSLRVTGWTGQSNTNQYIYLMIHASAQRE